MSKSPADDAPSSASGKTAGGPSAPRPLDQVQRWLQAVITHPSGVAAGVDSETARREFALSAAQVEQLVGRSKQLTSLERLAIYGSSYYLRLVECLRDMYPVLAHTMGELIFNTFAMEYLQHYPSQSYTLADLGAHLGDYLAQSRPTEAANAAAPSLPANWTGFFVELSRLEWAIGEVFDGPGLERHPPLSAADLAAIGPDRWQLARLLPSPSLRLLEFEFPVNDFYSAMRIAADADASTEGEYDHVERYPDALSDEENSLVGDLPIPEPEQTYLALVRQDYMVRRYPLSLAEYRLLEAIVARRTILEAIESAAAASALSDDAIAAAIEHAFHRWSAGRFFAGVEGDAQGEQTPGE